MEINGQEDIHKGSKKNPEGIEILPTIPSRPVQPSSQLNTCDSRTVSEGKSKVGYETRGMELAFLINKHALGIRPDERFFLSCLTPVQRLSWFRPQVIELGRLTRPSVTSRPPSLFFLLLSSENPQDSLLVLLPFESVSRSINHSTTLYLELAGRLLLTFLSLESLYSMISIES